jgi:quercetin dioxygenase-like cupin family protein
MLTTSQSNEIQETRATRESVEELQSAMVELPQAPGMDTTHFFGGGMYCRRIAIPAGRVIVSKVHSTEHMFIGCVGELMVAGQGENYTLRPGDVIVSPIGTKRVVFSVTDVVVMTVHKTDKTSVDDLEEELMHDDGRSLYDVNNQPKPGVLISSTPITNLEN